MDNRQPVAYLFFDEEDTSNREIREIILSAIDQNPQRISISCTSRNIKRRVKKIATSLGISFLPNYDRTE
jgi:hypothetical protein